MAKKNKCFVKAKSLLRTGWGGAAGLNPDLPLLGKGPHCFLKDKDSC